MSVPTEKESMSLQEILAELGDPPTATPVQRDPAERAAILVVTQSLELAIERGRIQPHEALAAGAFLGIPLPGWIQEKHDSYMRILEGRTP